MDISDNRRERISAPTGEPRSANPANVTNVGIVPDVSGVEPSSRGGSDRQFGHLAVVADREDVPERRTDPQVASSTTTNTGWRSYRDLPPAERPPARHARRRSAGTSTLMPVVGIVALVVLLLIGAFILGRITAGSTTAAGIPVPRLVGGVR